MPTLGSLLINVGANLDAFNASMGDLDSRLAQAEKDASKTWSGFEALGSRLTSLGATLTGAVTLPIVGIGAASATAFGEFQGALAKASALGALFGTDLDALKAQAIDLGAKTQFSAKQAADGMAELAAAGYNVNQITAAMPGLLSLAAAGQLSIAQAATVATDAIAQFGLKASDTGKVADVMAKAAAAGKDSVQGLGLALSYAGGPAHAVGLSLEETAAALTQLANAGDRGEKAGTRLREILIRLAKPPKEARTALEELGVTVNDSSGKMLPFADIIQQLADKHLTLKDAAKIAGAEGASGLLNLVNQGAPALRQLTTDLEGSKGAADRMAGILNGGLGGAMERMKGSIETAAIVLGEALAPTIITVAGLIEQLANKGAEFATWFGKLPEPIKEGAIALAALAAAIGPVLLVAGQVAGAIVSIQGAATVLTPVLGEMGIAFTGGAAAFAPWIIGIGAATAALVALGVWVNENWEPIKAVVAQAWAGLGEAWAAVWNPIQSYLTGVWGGIKSAGEALWYPVKLFYGTIWDGVGGYFTAAWNGIASSLGDVWNGIKATAASVWGGIVGVFQEFLSWAAKIPGANKLMNLDEAWASAKKHADALKAVSAETKTVTTTATKAGAAHKTLATNLNTAATASDKVGKAHKKTAEASEELTRKDELLWAIAKKLRDEHDKHIKALADLTIKYGDVANRVPELIQPSEELNQTVQKLVSNVKTIAPTWITAIDSTKDELTAALEPVRTLDAAYKTLGITGTKAAQDHATAAKDAYGVILASGTASAADLTAAWAKAQTAQIEAAKAAGTMTAAEAEKALADIKAKTESGLAGVADKWKGWGGEISGIITGLAGTSTKSLWEGPGSFAEKGTAALISLGKDVATHFGGPFGKEIGGLLDGTIKDLMGGKGFDGITDRLKAFGGQLLEHFTKPLTDTFNSLITGVFTDLIGGKGFGGLADAAKNAGRSIADVFGSTPTPGTTSPGTGVPGAPGGTPPPINGGGGGGGAAGAASSVAAAGAVVQAIGSIGTWITAIRQEGTLNAIEHNTRYSMMYLGERSDGGILGVLFRVQENTQFVHGQLDVISGKISDFFEPVAGLLEDLNGRAEWALKRLDQIGNDVLYGSASDRAQEAILADIRDAIRNDSIGRSQVELLGQIRDAIRATGAAPRAASVALTAATQGFVFA